MPANGNDEAAPAPARAAEPGLSTEEKNELARDASVRRAMGLFGGEVVDIRRDAPKLEDQET